MSNGLVALSSAAILAVYTAGYSRTRAAAEKLAVQSDERRPVRPIPAPVPAAATPAPAVAPTPAVPPPVEKPKAAEAVRVAVAKPAAEAPAAAPVETPAPVAAPEPAPAVPEPKVEAPPPPPPPVQAPAPPPPPAPKWKDGTYTGWGTSRHGDIEASVTIEHGQILVAKITQCLTRYSCDVIDQLPPQVAKRQSPEVDFVSGATQSANAFYYAVVEALSKAK